MKTGVYDVDSELDFNIKDLKNHEEEYEEDVWDGL